MEYKYPSPPNSHPAPPAARKDADVWQNLLEKAKESQTAAESVADTFAKQLLEDWTALQAGSSIDRSTISCAARVVPRTQSAKNDATHKLAYLIADRLSLVLIGARTAPLSRLQESKVWGTYIGALRRALNDRDHDEELRALEHTKRRRGWKRATLMSYMDTDFDTLPKPLPIHDNVSRPTPMPVDVPQDPTVFADIFGDLARNATESTTAERGRIFVDGRLDLCKQVVGPLHIRALMQSMRGNTHVRHFLLGNNICNDAVGTVPRGTGVAAIADYIQTANPDIHTWYLAGNEIDAVGADTLVSALLTGGRAARYLWLKRNPLGPEGATAVARLVREHPNLRLLDLQETGILDRGLVTLCDSLRGNQTLRTLYLDGCGIRAEGAIALAEVLNTTAIRNLFISVNAIRDEGCVALAAALRDNKTLKRLSLSSVGMGARGCTAICEAVRNHERLFMLDMGFYRTTIVLRELPNRLTDAAAESIATLLENNPRLKTLSVKCCYFTPDGMTRIIGAMEKAPALMAANVRQHDWCFWGELGNRLHALREKWATAGSMLSATTAAGENDFTMRLRNPRAVLYIRSVYRGKN